MFWKIKPAPLFNSNRGHVSLLLCTAYRSGKLAEAAAQQHLQSKDCMHLMSCAHARLVQVIRNSAAFPSPVIALGSQHTINDAIVAENGTVLQLAGWTAIYGLEERQVHACGASTSRP